VLAVALALAIGAAVLLVPAVVPTARAGAPVGVRGEQFVDAAGQPVFLLGANYEGPADRAWQMWDEGRYDARLIATDLTRARSGGISVLRVFVQKSLADDIRAGRWAKLDEFLRLTEPHGFKIILTFADYPDAQLTSLAAIDLAVAARYRGRSTILAYDLKNEPRFFDLALSEYPPGAYVALQDRAVIQSVGESIPREEIAAYRESEVGKARIPARLSDDRAHIYANLLAAYLQFLDDASAWNREHSSTSVAYLASPDSARWDPLKEALNDTLATWIKIRVDAVRAGDPQATVTIGHVDPILASLPANNLLDYRTLHRYPSASPAGIRSAMSIFRDVRLAIPGKPLVLGEFGFASSQVPEDRAAELEAEVVRAVRDAGGAGALKWMLNDFTEGASDRENSLGMFRGDGSPKPVVTAFRQLAGLPPITLAGPLRPPDYVIPEGHFFTQTSGRPLERDGSGYAVTNADDIRFWDAWQRLGGENMGYPLSRRFLWRGTPTQVFQRGVLVWGPEAGVVLVDLFDELHARGLDPDLQTRERIPPRIDPASEAAMSRDELVRSRMALLETAPALQRRYQAAPDPLVLYGLPTSAAMDLGDALAIRTQRAVLLQWRVPVPGVAAGDVTVVNGGEIAVRRGLFPISALVPEPPPPLDAPTPTVVPSPTTVATPAGETTPGTVVTLTPGITPTPVATPGPVP
jgi:hypothetical protein